MRSWNEDAFSSGQAAGFEDDGVATCFYVLGGVLELVGAEDFKFGSGDAVAHHEIFCKCLGAFHFCSEYIGTKDRNAD